MTENNEGEDDPDGIRSQLGRDKPEMAEEGKKERMQRKPKTPKEEVFVEGYAAGATHGDALPGPRNKQANGPRDAVSIPEQRKIAFGHGGSMTGGTGGKKRRSRKREKRKSGSNRRRPDPPRDADGDTPRLQMPADLLRDRLLI